MIRPLNDYILIREIGGETKTESGIILKAEDRSYREGEVLAISEALDVDFEVGDTILYASWGGRDAIDFEENMFLVDLEDVLAIAKD